VTQEARIKKQESRKRGHRVVASCSRWVIKTCETELRRNGETERKKNDRTKEL
jgi:hypothetical protein